MYIIKACLQYTKLLDILSVILVQKVSLAFCKWKRKTPRTYRNYTKHATLRLAFSHSPWCMLFLLKHQKRKRATPFALVFCGRKREKSCCKSETSSLVAVEVTFWVGAKRKLRFAFAEHLLKMSITMAGWLSRTAQNTGSYGTVSLRTWRSISWD